MKKENKEDEFPPCTIFNCEFKELCKSKILACQSFRFYVLKAESRHPHTQWQGAMKLDKTYTNEYMYPSRDQYIRANK